MCGTIVAIRTTHTHNDQDDGDDEEKKMKCCAPPKWQCCTHNCEYIC